MQSGFQLISLFGQNEKSQVIFAPIGSNNLNKTITDSFGVKTQQSFPASALFENWSMSSNFNPEVYWNVNISVNAPSIYKFPNYLKDSDGFIIYTSPMINLGKTNIKIEKKTRKILVTCPKLVEPISSGSAAFKQSTKIVVGDFVYNNPQAIPYTGPLLKGKTVKIQCLVKSYLPTSGNQVIAYGETTPLTVSLPSK
jgi:hypothetical protein